VTQAFNKVIRGIHGVAERANALLKVTFKALRRVSLDPAAITRIARAALVPLQLEHGRTTRRAITDRHETLPRKVHWSPVSAGSRSDGSAQPFCSTSGRAWPVRSATS
jgi:hypothetical protein